MDQPIDPSKWLGGAGVFVGGLLTSIGIGRFRRARRDAPDLSLALRPLIDQVAGVRADFERSKETDRFERLENRLYAVEVRQAEADGQHRAAQDTLNQILVLLRARP